MHRVSKEVIKAIHAQVMFRDCMNATLFTLLLRRIADAVIIRADKEEKTTGGTKAVQDAAEKILEGKFNDSVYSLDFSNPVIELNLCPGEVYEGSFTITGPENEVTEGTVSSTRLKMQALTSEFSGRQEEIGYRFDAYGMAEGDILKGEFRIISNHGEYFIPYDVNIVSGTLDSGLGVIKNLFHFANLARSNWDEAVNLFYSKDFEQIFVGVDRQYYGIYRGLVGSGRREQGVEEFLLEIRKKQKVEFLLEESDILIDNPSGRTENRLVITRNGWGYSELTIEREGDFIVLEKDVIREEDFLGNSYRLPFYISTEKLHAGKNFGCIRLGYPYGSLTAKITVNNKTLTASQVTGIGRQKKYKLLELMQYYEAFRTKKLSAASWLKETEVLTDALTGLDPRDISAKLFKAQLLITQERYFEAEALLKQADSKMEENFRPDIYSYYLYLTTLMNREEEYLDQVSSEVERIFAQNPDNWRIAWLLLYLIGDYAKSPSRKWIFLEEQFRQGCSSPIIYIEAWNLIAANPALLLRLEPFEMQILTYAAKKELITPEVIIQIVYLAQKVKTYSGRLFRILKACYQASPTEEVLQAICTLLIKGNVTGKMAFPWYEKGIERELRITRLYEHYMMSLDLSGDLWQEREIPKIVLMYFAFDSNLDTLHNSFLYAYVYRNQAQFPELYENYREQIERFAVFQILRGKSNQYLAYLYKNLISPVMLTEETAAGLSTVLFMHRLRVEREDIRKVILVYEKEKQETVFPFTGREVFIPIYGSDHYLLLEDAKGYRYGREEEYVCERLLVPEGLANLAAPYVSDNVHFNLWLCADSGRLASAGEENVEYMKRLLDFKEVREEILQEVRMRLLQFFYDNDRMTEMDRFLEELTPEQVKEDCHGRIVRFMVLRGMYEKAFEWIKLRGEEDMEAKIIMRLCSRLLTLDGMVETPAMTILAFRAFRAGKYDENLLNYLCRFFKGTSMEMRDIWKAAEDFGVDTYDLSERILLQMLYTGAYMGERTEIFKRYVSGGARTEVELAVLAQCSYDYFVRDKQTDAFVWEDLQRASERQENIPFVCKLAYTKYYAEHKKQVDERISHCLLPFLREILEQNKYFSYFKEYAEHIVSMRQFMDKTMVEYRVSAGNKAYIHYLLERERGPEEYIKEEMQDMFGGICVKQFVLFFGEHLQYYITEVEDGKEHLTESGTLSRNDAGGEQRENRYTLLNDIAISRNLHDYGTMDNLMREYFEQEFVVKELFHII